jgi:hypothetical protein
MLARDLARAYIDAIATLIRNQTVFVSATAEYRRDIQERTLADLADAVRERIGFKTPLVGNAQNP